MAAEKLTIQSEPKIAAIYYALLQSGYEYYPIERDDKEVRRLRGFIAAEGCAGGFFSQVKQSGCEAYPYWPRAALLETAAFFVDPAEARFVCFGEYQNIVRSAKNIADGERDERFWDWVLRFPAALRQVMRSEGFGRYLTWEEQWIENQNESCRERIKRVSELLDVCGERFGAPFAEIRIVLDPIKCVFASDYHHIGGQLTICLGEFREDSILHEWLHPAVHAQIERQRGEALRLSPEGEGLDASYSLNGGEAGRLNALEEVLVRRLTARILQGDIPKRIELF